MKKTLLAFVMVAAGSAFAVDFSVGINIGAPPPPPAAVFVQPDAPGPGFVWIQGYWYPVGRRYRWHEGYWTRPPYEGAFWVGPRHDGERYWAGYWDGPRGRFGHDHHWDRYGERDFHRGGWEHGHGHGRD